MYIIIISHQLHIKSNYHVMSQKKRYFIQIFKIFLNSENEFTLIRDKKTAEEVCKMNNSQHRSREKFGFLT